MDWRIDLVFFQHIPADVDLEGRVRKIWPHHRPQEVILSSPCWRAAFRSNSVGLRLVQSRRFTGFRRGDHNTSSPAKKHFLLRCRTIQQTARQEPSYPTPKIVWPINRVTISGRMVCLMHQNAKRSKSGPSRNQNSIMPENCVVSSSLNLRMRTSRTS